MKLLTFGGFLRYKRREYGYKLKCVAERLGITPEYLGEMEKDRKTNPSGDILTGLIRFFELNEEETALFYDLHAKANGIVSKDISDYIMEKGIIRKAIRAAKEKSAPNAEWKDFIKRINKTKKD
ncbi:MAG: helix-turn-helix domain-containing protein [Oscillospiraceae bacterium]|jgi:transcriptional regulator with XRE-family HTH domain|nr:helix-turn-helix domain-containing protein [Oscillospiraceae bacterium]